MKCFIWTMYYRSTLWFLNWLIKSQHIVILGALIILGICQNITYLPIFGVNCFAKIFFFQNIVSYSNFIEDENFTDDELTGKLWKLHAADLYAYILQLTYPVFALLFGILYNFRVLLGFLKPLHLNFHKLCCISVDSIVS